MNLEDRNFLPSHIGIIMDGNGRWAKQKGLHRTLGHRAGVKALKDIVKYTSKIGIKILTVYAFSTENWSRPKEEVDYLINTLLLEFLKKEIDELNENNVQIKVLGDTSVLPSNIRCEIEKAIKLTDNNKGMMFNIALNYGGRTEIIRAVKRIGEALLDNSIRLEEIDEKLFASFLYTNGISDPDLIIRTSGEKRISNFLLWQSAYSELYFSDVFWPDFKKNNLEEAIADYRERERRYGKLY